MASGLLLVEMGQGQGVGSLDRKHEIVRDGGGVFFDRPGIRQADTPGEKTPKPLVDFDGIEMSGVIGEIVVGPVYPVEVIDKAFPRIILPGTRPDPEVWLGGGWDFGQAELRFPIQGLHLVSMLSITED
jgi:hypothetical protein